MYYFQALMGMFLVFYYYVFKKTQLSIIFPEDNKELNQNAIDLAISYVEFSHVNKCNLIFNKNTVNKYNFDRITESKNCKFELLQESSNNIQNLMRYFSLQRGSKKYVVISFNYPFESNNTGLLKKNNLSLKELICYDIYHLTYIPEENRS